MKNSTVATTLAYFVLEMGVNAALAQRTPQLREISMSGNTHETAPTQFVQADAVTFAYRRFGPRGGIVVGASEQCGPLLHFSKYSVRNAFILRRASSAALALYSVQCPNIILPG
jgi:hypothetical protein